MRFVHISDLHLGKTFPVARYGQLAARRRQELLDTFSRLIDYVNENQVDFILCSAVSRYFDGDGTGFRIQWHSGSGRCRHDG